LYYVKSLSRFRCKDARINNAADSYQDIFEYVIQ